MKPEGKEYEKPKKAVFRNKWFLTFLIAGVIIASARYAWYGQFLVADGHLDGV